MVALQRLWLRLWNGILAPKIAMEQLRIMMQLKIHLIHGTSLLISLHIPQPSNHEWESFMLDRMIKNIKHQDPHVIQFYTIYTFYHVLSQSNIYNMINICKTLFHILPFSCGQLLRYPSRRWPSCRGPWISTLNQPLKKKNGSGVDLGEFPF